MTVKRFFSMCLFTIGVMLLGLNVFGLFKSLRNEELYSEITPYKNDISIRFEDAKKQWKRGHNELERDYVSRMTMLINHSMAHYWKDEGIKKYYMKVPLWENYVLRVKQWVTGNEKYEFRNYKKVIERGVGICSQPCIALQNLLNANGIEADLWDLKQHIVVGVRFVDGIEYTLDPDYGYVIPLGMEQLKSYAPLVREAYKNHDQVYASHVKTHKHTEDIVQIYTQEGNNIYHIEKAFEDFSYYLKWILPVLLMIPFLLKLILKRKA